MTMENYFHMEALIIKEIIHILHHNLKMMRMTVVSTLMRSSLKQAESHENSSQKKIRMNKVITARIKTFLMKIIKLENQIV